MWVVSLWHRLLSLFPLTVITSILDYLLLSMSSAQDSDGVASTAQQFAQGEFKKEEKVFLNEFLPTWFSTFYSDDDQTAGKGDKKDWVIQNVYPKFKEKFYPDGTVRPTAVSLQTVSLFSVDFN
jgi:hypothetical protein